MPAANPATALRAATQKAATQNFGRQGSKYGVQGTCRMRFWFFRGLVLVDFVHFRGPFCLLLGSRGPWGSSRGPFGYPGREKYQNVH